MLRLEHRPARVAPLRPSGPELVEIITPRTNAAALSAAEHLFAALVGARGLALELAGDATGRRLYARTADPTTRARLAAQLGAAYPQAHARPASGADDPAHLRPGEQLAACTLRLAAPGPPAWRPLPVSPGRGCPVALIARAPPVRPGVRPQEARPARGVPRAPSAYAPPSCHRPVARGQHSRLPGRKQKRLCSLA